VCRTPLAPQIEGAAFCAAAGTLLPPEPWDDATWAAWTQAVRDATGRKGRALFHPLRLALTGHEHGPDLKTLLPLIGRDRACMRLSGQTA
jgi:glutamyl-tRNA synthetase